MKNIDLFVKYEQGLLDQKEKVWFEKELETSIEFKNDFNMYLTKLNSLSNNIEVNEQYFINLLPNVRNRIKNQKPFIFSLKFVYSLPVLILLVFIIYNVSQKDTNKLEYNFDKWFSSFTNDEEVMENLFANVLSSDDDYLLIENNFIEMNKDEFDDLLFNEINNLNSENYMSRDVVDEDFIQQFSKEQFDEVYTVLINKNIL